MQITTECCYDTHKHPAHCSHPQTKPFFHLCIRVWLSHIKLWIVFWSFSLEGRVVRAITKAQRLGQAGNLCGIRCSLASVCESDLQERPQRSSLVWNCFFSHEPVLLREPSEKLSLDPLHIINSSFSSCSAFSSLWRIEWCVSSFPWIAMNQPVLLFCHLILVGKML